MIRISRRRLAFLIAAVVGGARLGTIASERGGGGLSFMGSGIAMGFSVFVLICLAVFAIASATQRDGIGRSTARATILAGVVFAASFGGGWTAATIARGPDPVQLEAVGTMTLTLGDLPGFAQRVDAFATCRSPVGFETVQEVLADAAGSIGAYPVYFSLSMNPDNPGIEPGILVSLRPALGEFAPEWSGGRAALLDGILGGPSGRVTFSGVPMAGNASDGVPPGWPLRLSGEIVWSCEDWTR
jgi:hypothetical protein